MGREETATASDVLPEASSLAGSGKRHSRCVTTIRPRVAMTSFP